MSILHKAYSNTGPFTLNILLMCSLTICISKQRTMHDLSNTVPAISSKSSQQKHTPRVCFGSLVSVITVRLQDCCEVESREPLFKYYQNGV